MTRVTGTDSRVGRYVRGTCAVCGAEDELVYETDSETGLVCATDYRGWSARHKDRLKQTCDDCGSTANVFRDPITRKNEYLCLKCHTARGMIQTTLRKARKPHRCTTRSPQTARPTMHGGTNDG